MGVHHLCHLADMRDVDLFIAVVGGLRCAARAQTRSERCPSTSSAIEICAIRRRIFACGM